MSWIRSDKALLRHPKTAHLKILLNVETETVIGRLHMLWWWCLDYALDGNLSKHHHKVIENACNIPLKLLISSKFVDKSPYVRIHDWWDNQGNYLKLRFRDQPDFWNKIKDSYTHNLHMGKHMGKHVSTPTGKTVDVDLHTDVRYLTNGRDVDLTLGEASRNAPGGASAPQKKGDKKVDDFEVAEANKAWKKPTPEKPEIKSWDEAGPNDLCGPPPDMWAKVKGLKK